MPFCTVSGGEERIGVEELADGHPSGLGIHERAQPRQDVAEFGLVLVVEVDAARGCGTGPRRRRVRAQRLILDEQVEHIEPEAIHPPIEPSLDHRELGIGDAGCRQFTSGCSARKVWR